VTALLRAELARAAARPLVWLVAAGLVLGAIGLVALGWWETRPPSAAEVAAADLAYQDVLGAWEADGDARIAKCRDLEATLRAEQPGQDLDLGCDAMAPVPEMFLPLRPGLGELLDGRLPSIGVMLVLGLLMVGVGLVTSDLQSGAMGTWLTFAPRRGRVLVSRLVAAVVAALPCGLLALAVLVAGLALVCAVHGTSLAVPAAEWASMGGRAGRWLVAGLGATALGVGLAFALRHAAAVTGLVVWWGAAIESALPLVLPSARWLPLSTNLTAWTSGQADYGVETCVPDPRVPGGEVCEEVLHVVGMGQGALVTGAMVVVALVAGWVVFRLRDVP